MTISAEQTLHGYEQGHRLLAGSVKLSHHEARTMQVLSDLAGGQTVQPSQSYLTGYPLRESRMYAIARTWMAPEMERPGCVWTHTILLPMSTLIQIESAHAVTSRFQRPLGQQFETYRQTLEVDTPPHTDSDIDHRIAAQLIKTFYERPAPVWLGSRQPQPDTDALAMKLWLQQWPRLRRTHTFCTRASDVRALDGKPFHLLVGTPRAARRFDSAAPVLGDDQELEAPAWATIAATDLEQPIRGFREFIGLAGADANARRQFIDFTQLYLDWRNGAVPDKVLTRLRGLWPTADEGSDLKQILLKPGSQSQLPGDGPSDWEKLSLLALSQEELWPLDAIPVEELVQSAAREDERRTLGTVAAVVDTQSSSSRIKRRILGGFAGAAGTQQLNELWERSNLAALELAEAEPTLVSNRLLEMHPPARQALLPRVIQGLPDQELAPFLKDLCSNELLDELDPSDVNETLIEAALRLLAAGELERWPKGWFDDRLLPQPRALTTELGSTPTPGLLELASIVIDPGNRIFTEVTSESWESAIVLAKPIQATLVAGYLSLRDRSESEAAPAYVRAFNAIHQLTNASTVQQHLWRDLDRRLPRPMPWQSWDRSRRLRKDLANRFTLHGWPAAALHSVRSDRRMSRQLRDEFSDLRSDQSRKYVRYLDPK